METPVSVFVTGKEGTFAGGELFGPSASEGLCSSGGISTLTFAATKILSDSLTVSQSRVHCLAIDIARKTRLRVIA